MKLRMSAFSRLQAYYHRNSIAVEFMHFKELEYALLSNDAERSSWEGLNH